MLAARLPERVGVELGRQRHHAPEASELAVDLGRPLRVGQRHARALGEGAHRLGEGERDPGA